MSSSRDIRWTDADFASLSWHDNHVHGLRVSEGQYGAGELILDLDFIIEWICSDAGVIQFLVAPASLTFHQVTDLEIQLNYRSAGAAMAPFSIDGIERRRESRDRYTATIWTIPINFPSGRISFEATGFSQVLRASPIVKDQQSLTEAERRGIP